MSDNAGRLEDLIGFDASKPSNLTNDLFQEVLSDIKKERFDTAKKAAREQLVKAVELREKMVKIEREFNGQKAKFEKELGKLLSRLESSLGGREPAPEDPADNSAQQAVE